MFICFCVVFRNGKNRDNSKNMKSNNRMRKRVRNE